MNQLNNGKVLLLDDDTFLTRIYSEKFSEAHFAFQSANSADDAIRILRGGYVPDVLIVDIELKDKDGFVFLQAVKDQRLAEGAHVIMLTNHSEENDKQRAIALGVDSYIVKAVMIPDEVVQETLRTVQKKNSPSA